MEAEVQRLRQITGESQGTDPKLIEQLSEVETQLVKAKLVNQIEDISNLVESKEIQNESDSKLLCLDFGKNHPGTKKYRGTISAAVCRSLSTIPLQPALLKDAQRNLFAT